MSEGKLITLINNSEPEPYIAIIRPGYYHESHPNQDDVYLVIEFSNSSLAKDLNEKRLVYASAGIQEYWVVNLRGRQFIVFRNSVDGNYQSEQNINWRFNFSFGIS
ncbi:Uma2 family endonuclease [Okeania sp. SIO1I7]|uniref:Uma2 family endonuclease n=1 Tax=Okeania sp. SIO1I7 TaxID=2607772 RepID=UPI0025D96ECE|nr:Uma2 family endonuclease [Okeania sp. SIO1I7]